MRRRHLLAASAAALAVSPFARGQAIEKPALTIAVGGKNLLYYLPLTIAETQGYFKAEGLDVTIADFAGRLARPAGADRRQAPTSLPAPSSTPSTCR